MKRRAPKLRKRLLHKYVLVSGQGEDVKKLLARIIAK